MSIQKEGKALPKIVPACFADAFARAKKRKASAPTLIGNRIEIIVDILGDSRATVYLALAMSARELL